MPIRTRTLVAAVVAGLATAAALYAATRHEMNETRAVARQNAKPRCDPDNGGIHLPRGACAVVVGEQWGARQILVAANGDIFMAVARSEHGAGGVTAMRDTDSDGRADVIRRFGASPGTGIALSGDYLYFAPNDAVLRWRLAPGQLEPAGPPDTIVEQLPSAGDHTSKTIVLDGQGNLFVSIGSATNSCQAANRMLESPGTDPCTELDTRAGIWLFQADRSHQRLSDGRRYATGIRNAVGLTLDARGRLWAVQHGRDQLFQNWPKLYDARQGAELPAEELLLVNDGDDFGWPYCYYDQFKHRLVLAPEYGGDGRKVGRCAGKKNPVVAFPGHWAPDAVLFTQKTAIPGFQTGVFIAFHGSWNRAPQPQAGYKVVFVPIAGDKAGKPVTFADDFAGPGMGTGKARYRPDGLAQGPDGSIYIAADWGGRIWRVLPAPH